jgi:hypothetical protein
MWSPGLDRQAGGSQAAVDQVGPVLDLLELALDDADQAVQVGGGEVGDGPLEQRPVALRRVEVRRVGGQPVDAQPGLVLLGEVRQVRGEVDVEVVPDPDQRGAQLPVGGDDQVPVISPAEPFGLALAAPVDPSGGRTCAAGRRAGSRPPRAMLTRPPPAPRTRTTGRAPRRAQVRLSAASAPGLPPSKQTKAPRSRAVLLCRATPGLSTPRPPHHRVPSPAAPGPGLTSRAGASASTSPRPCTRHGTACRSAS